MSRLLVLLALAALAHLTLAQSSLCDFTYCECSPATHPSWIIVNCTVPPDQKLNILEGDLPLNTTELVVTGAVEVLFGINSLSRLRDARHIRIRGPKAVLMRKFTAVNLNVINVYLEIEDCDSLRIEEKTFTNIKGPLSVSIKNCTAVSLGSEAFSWLLKMNIDNVQRLELSPAAFMLDSSAANVGAHGPGMMIYLKNLTVPEFTSQTFGSSAAVIKMEGVSVDDIRPESFSANTYNIVMAVNSSFRLIHGQAFAQKSLINNFQLYGCKVNEMMPRALQSAITDLNITRSTFKKVDTGAINITAATVIIVASTFKKFAEKGVEVSSWTKFEMVGNSFDDLPSHAIVAPGASRNELIFSENEIETIHDNSLDFIGQAQSNSRSSVVYKMNFFGQQCHCNVSSLFKKILATDDGETFTTESFCTINEILARCFNVPEQNMLADKFLKNVCLVHENIKCEPYKTKTEGLSTEIKNPRFPHEDTEEEGLSDRNKKVIGIVIVTCLGCILIALFISFIRWMRQRGHCLKIKNFLVSSNSSCASICDRFCSCGSNGLDNAGSISQLSVNEYSERHRLNEPRVHDIIQETSLPDMYTQEIVESEDKTTQTLPEELTKELLESLKENLDDPKTYAEAREMIEHLYELIKVEESCNNNTSETFKEENIYELPFQNTVPRLGKNKKQMISIGTKTPSLEKLQPLSPYNRQTSLAHEYFEPKDFAVHLYAEIANNERDRKHLMNAMPDVVAEQAVPRGPYLKAVREKVGSNGSSSPPVKSVIVKATSPHQVSSIKSNNSIGSNSSAKMLNRPLPEKPTTFDPGEGTSFRH